MRDLPFGCANQNNANLANANYRYATIFKPGGGTGNITVYGVLHTYKTTGAGNVADGAGYWRGNGGILRCKIHPVNSNGTPNLGTVLATVADIGGTAARNATVTGYGVASSTQCQLFKLQSSVVLDRQTIYAFVMQNVDPSPYDNWGSVNCGDIRDFSNFAQNSTVTVADVPSGKTSVNGLDELERAMWSTNSGSTWVVGTAVGAGSSGSGQYSGAAGTDDATRLPCYGLVTSPITGTTGWPRAAIFRYAYNDNGQYRATNVSWRWKQAPRATTITALTAYVHLSDSAGGNPGVLTATVYKPDGTVRDTASTSSQTGTGLVSANLGHSLNVLVGDDVKYAASGKIVVSASHDFLRILGDIGNPAGPCPWGSVTGTTHDFDIPNVGPRGAQHAWFHAADVDVAGADTTPPAQPATPTLTALDGAVRANLSPLNTEADLSGYNLQIKLSSQDATHWTDTVVAITTWPYTRTGLTNGTSYDFRVIAFDTPAGNASTPSTSASATPAAPGGGDTTPPAKPATPTATPLNTSARIALSPLNTESDLASYTLQRKLTSQGSGSWSNVATGITTWPQTNSSLTNGTSYDFRVIAVDTTGNASTPSDPVSVTPAAPPANSDVLLLKPIGASMSETAAPANTPDKANDGQLNTRWSTGVNVVGTNIDGDLGSAYSLDSFQVAWELAYASSYTFQSRLTTSDPWTNVVTQAYAGPGTADVEGPFVTTTLASPVTARYVRLLVNTFGTAFGVSIWRWSAYGTAISSTPDTTPPAKPQTPTADPLDGGASVDLPVRNTETDLAGYTVEMQIHNSGLWNISQTGVSSFPVEISSLSNGTTYDVRIKAYDNATPANVSTASNTVTVTPSASAPPPPSVTDRTVGRITASERPHAKITAKETGDLLEGAVLEYRAVVRDSQGVLGTPDSLRLRLLKPSGQELSFIDTDTEMVEEETGIYHVLVTLDEPGDWVRRWESTGDLQDVAQKTINVEANAFDS